MARFGHAASAVALILALSSSALADDVTSYTYDVHGRLKRVTRPTSTTDYTYDNAQNRTRLTTVMASGNHAPVANVDNITVAAGGTYAFNPLANDSDADSDNFYLASASGSAQNKGNVTPVANCLRTAATCVTYQAFSSSTGSDSFTYVINDGHGGTATGTVNVTINAAPSLPVANNFTTSVAGNSLAAPLPLSITGGTPTSVSLYSVPANATATPSGTNINFKPNTGWSGQTSLQYTATNSAGTSSPATATIKVTPVVGAIHTNAIGGQWNAIALNPQTNYTSLALTGNPQKGSAYISGTTLYYNPLVSQVGSGDIMTYQATTDGIVGNYGVVFIDDITAAPNRNPVAVTDNVNIAANSYAYFDPRTNDSDPDGDALTLVSVTGAQHGSTWTNSNNYISYVPATGWSGTDYFYYTISDGKGGTATGAVNVYVSPPPVNHPPVANAQTTDPVYAGITTYIYPTRNDTDPDGDALTIQSIDNFYFAYGHIDGVDVSGSNPPANFGSVTNYGSYVAYNAPHLSAGSYMAVVFYYTISDGKGGTSQNYEVINVYGPG